MTQLLNDVMLFKCILTAPGREIKSVRRYFKSGKVFNQPGSTGKLRNKGISEHQQMTII